MPIILYGSEMWGLETILLLKKILQHFVESMYQQTANEFKKQHNSF